MLNASVSGNVDNFTMSHMRGLYAHNTILLWHFLGIRGNHEVFSILRYDNCDSVNK